MMDPATWYLEQGDGPLVAAAIHHGHSVRAELVELLALDESDMLREEDPCTGEWTRVAPTRIIVYRSRFEVDLNRPREKAVYLQGEDAWGLEVWKQLPPPEALDRSRAIYDEFYGEVRQVLEDLSGRFGRVVVFDLHSYNHRRGGPTAPPADPAANPEVNLGTGNMNRRLWQPVVDSWAEAMRSFDFLGRNLDVREDVKFTGGNFSRWIHQTFPESVCCLAVEFKKTFMDEWSGRVDGRHLYAIESALRSAADAVLETLQEW
jgi:N-formylglutamate deformylase